MKLRPLSAIAAGLAIAASALAYVPKQDLKIEKVDGDFRITGKNSHGPVEVKVTDKNLFSGFKAEGKNGDRKVEIEVRSAGLGAGWKLEGKNGDERVEVRCKQKGPFQDWAVTGKVGSRTIEAEVPDEWAIDPAARAVLVILDCCDPAEEVPAKPKP